MPQKRLQSISRCLWSAGHHSKNHLRDYLRLFVAGQWLRFGSEDESIF